MAQDDRRSFLHKASVLPLGGLFAVTAAGKKATDIRIEEVRLEYEDFQYRTPIKFGGTVVDRVTLLNVHCRVTSRSGKSASGFGSMPLGNVWSFPSKTMKYDATLNAMKALAEKLVAVTAGCKEYGHPIDLNCALEPAYEKQADETSRQLRLPEAIPRLCAMVVASPFDAAVHDAFGKIHGKNCYHTYGPEFVSRDLSHYLGPEFQGEYLPSYLHPQPQENMPLYHLVGAVDPILSEDIRQRIGDGLPETLPEWIQTNGLTHIKIKLNGDDLRWDVERVLRMDHTATETQNRRGVKRWFYSLDFNEKCQNVEYLLEFLRQVKEKAPSGFQRIQYIEQPTGRDLKANAANKMHQASRLLPVVIDESLTDKESLLSAREMGYSGVALKACKGQSQALLMAALAQKHRMFLCVQDLTCPGASLIHSAGLAAHIRGVAAIEANARQYVPAANRAWEEKFPGVFTIRSGRMNTGILKGIGLGAV